MFCVVQEGLQYGFIAQVDWCGGGTYICLLPPGRLSAQHACNCSLLWRCIASGSWRRIAPTYRLSCSVSTPSWSWSRTSSVARFCLWCGMMALDSKMFRGTCPSRHLPTLLSSLGRGLRPLAPQFGASIIRCTKVHIYLVYVSFRVSLLCHSLCH